MSTERAGGRRGTVLLDVLLAMVLLAVGGVSLVVCLADSVHILRVMRARDAEVRAAAAVLSRAGSWSRAELLARSGFTTRDTIKVIIAPVGPALYRVSTANAVTGAILLETSFYRPAVPGDDATP